jgi:hypothetical protein
MAAALGFSNSTFDLNGLVAGDLFWYLVSGKTKTRQFLLQLSEDRFSVV